jgi:hypothetical protein
MTHPPCDPPAGPLAVAVWHDEGRIAFNKRECGELLMVEFTQHWEPVGHYLTWMYQDSALLDTVECSRMALTAQWTQLYFDAHPQWTPATRVVHQMAISRLWQIVYDGVVATDSTSAIQDYLNVTQNTLDELTPSWAAAV